MTLRSPVAALTWQLWRRQLWLAAGLGVYIGGLAVAAHWPGAAGRATALFTACTPIALAALLLLAAFGFPEGDVTATESGYPRFLLTLPASTRTLALLPLLHGAATAALLWLLPAALILRPLGVPVPLAWPAALAAAMLALVQMLLWTPFGIPYVRLALTVVAVPALAVLAVQAASRGLHPAALTAALLTLLALAAAGATRALALTRRGEVLRWPHPTDRRTRPRQAVPGSKSRPLSIPGYVSPSSHPYGWDGEGCPKGGVRPHLRPPAQTPLHAQIWLESRTHARLLPLLTALLCTALSLPLVWIRDLQPLGDPGAPLSDLEVNAWLRLQPHAFLFLPLLAAIIGSGRSRGAGRSGAGLAPFIAARPLTSAQLIAARFLASVRGAALSWGIVLGCALLWLLLPARQGGRTGPLLFLLADRWSLPEWAAMGALLLVLVIWTCKAQLQGAWTDASGRRWLIEGAPLVLHSLTVVGCVAAMYWYVEHRGERGAALPGWLFWALGAAVAARLAAGTVITIAAARRRVLTPRALAGAVAAWCGVVVLVWASFAQLAAARDPVAATFAAGYLPFLSPVLPAEARSPGSLLLLAVLAVPFARLLLAPVALDANRHR
jgi:hypothetical protein